MDAIGMPRISSLPDSPARVHAAAVDRVAAVPWRARVRVSGVRQSTSDWTTCSIGDTVAPKSRLAVFDPVLVVPDERHEYAARIKWNGAGFDRVAAASRYTLGVLIKFIGQNISSGFVSSAATESRSHSETVQPRLVDDGAIDASRAENRRCVYAMDSVGQQPEARTRVRPFRSRSGVHRAEFRLCDHGGRRFNRRVDDAAVQLSKGYLAQRHSGIP